MLGGLLALTICAIFGPNPRKSVFKIIFPMKSVWACFGFERFFVCWSLLTFLLRDLVDVNDFSVDNCLSR